MLFPLPLLPLAMHTRQGYFRVVRVIEHNGTLPSDPGYRKWRSTLWKEGVESEKLLLLSVLFTDTMVSRLVKLGTFGIDIGLIANLSDKTGIILERRLCQISRDDVRCAQTAAEIQHYWQWRIRIIFQTTFQTLCGL